jgi:hypothetical protein
LPSRRPPHACFLYAHSARAFELAHAAAPLHRTAWRRRQIALQTLAGVAGSLAFAWVDHSAAATVSVIAVQVCVYAIGVTGMLAYRSAVLSFSVGMWCPCAPMRSRRPCATRRPASTTWRHTTT